MAVNLQELQSRSPIVNADGTPSQYFLNYLRDRGGSLTTIDATVIALGTEVDALAAQLAGKVDKTQQVIAGSGLTGGGALTGDVTLNADASAILDQLGTTRGAVIYRGASGWAVLNPGTSGDALKTNGAGADPSWGPVASTANIQTLLDGISTTQGVILYYNGTDWVALSPGTSGQYLQTLGTGANPTWASNTGFTSFIGTRRQGVGPALSAGVTTTLTWSTEDYNDGGWTYSAGEFTVPSGVSKVDLNMNLLGSNVTDQLVGSIDVAADGVTWVNIAASDTDTAGTDSVSLAVMGHPVTGGTTKIRFRAFSTQAQSLSSGAASNCSIRASQSAVSAPAQGAVVRRVANQSVATSTDAALSFDTADQNTNALWVAGSPTRITVAVAGWYNIAGFVAYASTTNQFFYARVGVNGSFIHDFLGPTITTGSPVTTIQYSLNRYLNVGDYITITARQTTGGAVNVTGLLTVALMNPTSNGTWATVYNNASVSLGAGSNIDLNLTPYNEVQLVAQNILKGSAGAFFIRFSTDGGATYNAGTVYIVDVSVSGIPGFNDTAIYESGTSTTTRSFHFQMNNLKSTLPRPFIGWRSGIFNVSAGITHMRISTTAGGITGGSIQVLAR